MEEETEGSIVKGLKLVASTVKEETEVFRNINFLKFPEEMGKFQSVEKNAGEILGHGRKAVKKLQAASEEINDALEELKELLEKRIEEARLIYTGDEYDKDVTAAFEAGDKIKGLLDALNNLTSQLKLDARNTDLYMEGVQDFVKEVGRTRIEAKNLRKELEAEKKREREEAKRREREEKKRQEEERRKREEEERLQREEEERLKREAEERQRKEEEERLQREEEERIAREKEEQRLREEEERRRKEEEERKRREEQKRQEEERRRQRLEKERLKREEEELKKRDAERKNPKNWPIWIKYLDNEEIGCVIRAIPGLLKENDFIVGEAEKDSAKLLLDDFEERASSLMTVTYTSDEKPPKLEAPLNISLPIGIDRISHGKEIIMKMKKPSDNWTELESGLMKFEEAKGIKFTAGELDRVKKVSSLALVCRNKVDTESLNKKGGEVISSVDKGIRYTVPAEAIDIRVTATIQVQLMDSNTIQDAKRRRSDICSHLLGSSAIIDIGLPEKLSKPMTVEAPVSGAKKEQRRPQTSISANRMAPSPPERQKTVPSFSAENSERENVKLVSKNRKGRWSVMPEVTCCTSSKKSEMITFQLKKPVKRFVLIRASAAATDEQITAMAEVLENALNMRPVKILLKQHHTDPLDIAAQCVPASKAEHYENKLQEEGYSKGPSPSKELLLMENQILPISITGNIKPMINRDKELQLVYNSNFPRKVRFNVEVTDHFLAHHRGRVIVSSRTFESREVAFETPEEQENSDDEVESAIMEKKDEKICELQIDIPKKPLPDIKAKTGGKARVTYRSNGCVDEQFLKELAEELGDDWIPAAKALELSRSAVERIKKENKDEDVTELAFKMLMNWIKTTNRSADKVKTLFVALNRCGREDLAFQLKAKNEQFKKQIQETERQNQVEVAA